MPDRPPRAVFDVNVLLRIILSKKPAGAAIVTQDADLLDLVGAAVALRVEILDPLQFLLKLRELYRAP
jgi:predicted nucleic acid-binding protein